MRQPSKTWLIALTFGLCACNATSPESRDRSGDAGSADDQICESLCEDAVPITDCSNEDARARCRAECPRVIRAAQCVSEGSSYLTCMQQRGQDAYACTATGDVELRSEVCGNERRALDGCDSDAAAQVHHPPCNDSSSCPLSSPECAMLADGGSSSGMCSRSCDEDIHCRPGDVCVENTGIGLAGVCFTACETSPCPGGFGCSDWQGDPEGRALCVPDGWT